MLLDEFCKAVAVEKDIKSMEEFARAGGRREGLEKGGLVYGRERLLWSRGVATAHSVGHHKYDACAIGLSKSFGIPL